MRLKVETLSKKVKSLLALVVNHLSLAILTDFLAVFLPLAFSSPLLPEPVAASSVSRSPNSQLSSPATTSGSSAASVGTLGETCNNSDALEEKLTSFVNGWLQATNWFGKPETGIDMLIQNFGSQLINNLNSTPWPDINQRARLARVPLTLSGLKTLRFYRQSRLIR